MVLTVGAAGKPLPARPAAAHKVAADQAGPRSWQPEGDPFCPPGTLPDGDVCVHIPTEADESAPDAPAFANAHHERSGRWAIYDQIPRRPERPADYDAYRYPVEPGLPGGHCVVSGYDLDRPDTAQRRGRTLHAVGHGGVDLPQVRGAHVSLVPLDHQQGDADVLFTGFYFGTTVITRHTVREAGKLREYVAIFGHLDDVAPGVKAGTTLRSGDLVGFVGDTGSPELVHLHYETRRVRDGVDVKKQAARGPQFIVDDATSIVCDPRNVLPMR